MPTTTDMLLAWDQQRVRSQQIEIGWSEIGGCRRRAGYRLAETIPDNPGSSIQAVMGTAIDEATNTIAAKLGLLAQQEITFLGITGHFDRVEPILDEAGQPTGDYEVVDVKTAKDDRWLEHLEIYGPPEQHKMQVNGYGAALLVAGWRITHCRIDYIARDTGREWSWRRPYSPTIVKQAVEWLKLVRDTDVDMLPRDFEPDSNWCRHCPFLNRCWGGKIVNRDPRSVIHVEDPDTAKWAAELKALRVKVKELQARDKHLAGILDAVRPDDPTNGDKRELVDTGAGLIEFRPTKTGYAVYFRGDSAITKGTTP
jgi:PD-(D/E)XK nuclease superfamily